MGKRHEYFNGFDGHTESGTWAAVAITVWTSFMRLSAPMCAFVPKRHRLPFCLAQIRIAPPFLNCARFVVL